jgi:hypothetical protein
VYLQTDREKPVAVTADIQHSVTRPRKTYLGCLFRI